MLVQLRREDIETQLSPETTRQMVLLKGDEAPLYTRLQSMPGGTVETGNVETDWFTDTLGDIRDQVDNGGDAYDDEDDEIVVDDGAKFRPNDIVKAEATDEVMFVLAVVGDTLTVVRGYAGSVAHANSVANNAWLRIIGYAAGEGANAPEARMRGATQVKNHTQIFREVVRITGTAQASSLRTEDEELRQANLKFEEVLRKIDQAMLFGRKGSRTDAQGNTARTLDGLRNVIQTNVENINGNLTSAKLKTFTRKLFASGGGSRRLALCGSTALDAIYTLHEGRVQVRQDETTYGLTLRTVLTAHGELDLLYHPNMNFDAAGEIIAVNERDLKIRPLRGRGLRWNRDIQSNDADAVMHEWAGELTLEYGAEERHGRAYGITGAA